MGASLIPLIVWLTLEFQTMHRRSLSPIFTPDSPFMKKPINKGEASTSAVRVIAYETGSEPLCAMKSPSGETQAFVLAKKI